MALAAPTAAPDTSRRWINGPWLDFLTLGGGSFVVLGALAALWPRDAASTTALAGAMLLLAHVVNHPHFAHSYQLFYRDFRRKAFADGSPLAARYRFAGIMIPAVLAMFFAVALSQGNAALLGLAGHVMFFTVGWHYAKQGYGILMLDAGRKGLRLTGTERRWLLGNTHLVWFTWWLVANDALQAKDLWGIEYYLLDIPDVVMIPMLTLAALSTAATALAPDGGLPADGYVSRQRPRRLCRGRLHLAVRRAPGSHPPVRRAVLPLAAIHGRGLALSTQRRNGPARPRRPELLGVVALGVV